MSLQDKDENLRDTNNNFNQIKSKVSPREGPIKKLTYIYSNPSLKPVRSKTPSSPKNTPPKNL